MTTYTVAGAFSYTVPTWADYLDVILLGGGGGGRGGGILGHGNSGGGGSWATSTIASPTGTYVGVVGAGGAGGAGQYPVRNYGVTGSATTLTSPSLSAAGGVGYGGSSGPGTTTFNSQTYVGGADGIRHLRQSVGQRQLPRRGGQGGGSNSTGGAGASGGIWFFAYQAVNTPSGPITIVPTSFASQTPISGNTTLYVMLVNGTPGGGSGIVTASILRPALYVVPFPA